MSNGEENSHHGNNNHNNFIVFFALCKFVEIEFLLLPSFRPLDGQVSVRYSLSDYFRIHVVVRYVKLQICRGLLDGSVCMYVWGNRQSCFCGTCNLRFWRYSGSLSITWKTLRTLQRPFHFHISNIILKNIMYISLMPLVRVRFCYF
jgi:hypothetical protein